MARQTLTWRPSTETGFGTPVTFTVSRSDYSTLIAMWRRVRRLTPGPNRTAAIGELRTLLDLHALLDAHDADEALPDPGLPRVGRFMAPAHGAPDTQRQAAISVYPRTGTQRRQVLDLISDAGDRGRTDEELEHLLQGRHQTISARRNELAADEWIVDSGRRRRTTSGRDAVVWVITDAAHAQLAV